MSLIKIALINDHLDSMIVFSQLIVVQFEKAYDTVFVKWN